MKLRPALLTKVLLLAFLNLLVLAVAFYALVRLELRLDVESFLVSPARNHILAVGRLLALQLAAAERPAWDGLISQAARDNGVEMRLVDARGDTIAGSREPLPPGLRDTFLARVEPSSGMRSRGRFHRDEFDLAFLGTAGQPVRHWAAVPAPLSGRGVRGPEAHTWILIASSGQDNLFHVDRAPWIAAAGIVLAVSLAFWLPFVRGLTRSISRMSQATAQIAEGRFDAPLPHGRNDELGDLSASISRMASRLNHLVTGQQRYLRDAAHELRSPLARMQVALGLLERESTPAQRTALGDLSEDVQQMGMLVDDLLALSRTGQHPHPPHLNDVPLVPLVAQAAEREGTDGLPIRISVEEGLLARADEKLLLRALSNVLRNAVRYAGHAGPIDVTAQAQGAEVRITVADCGPGIPEQDLESVFEPFFRPEAARQRETGGVGLGLAIVRSSIGACGGTVLCRNRQPSGLEVEIKLPKGGLS